MAEKFPKTHFCCDPFKKHAVKVYKRLRSAPKYIVVKWPQFYLAESKLCCTCLTKLRTENPADESDEPDVGLSTQQVDTDSSGQELDMTGGSSSSESDKQMARFALSKCLESLHKTPLN